MKEPGSAKRAESFLLYAVSLPLCFIAALRGLGWIVRKILPDLSDVWIRVLVELPVAALVFLIFKNIIRKGEKRPLSLHHFLFSLCITGLPCWILAAYNLFSGPLQSGFGNILGAAAGAFAVGLCEELVFRGAAFNGLRTLWPEEKKAALRAALISSCVFGLIHLFSPEPTWGETLLQVVFAFSAGVYLCGVFIFAGTLLIPVLLHSILNACAFLLLSDGSTAAVWVQGGASALFLILGLALLSTGIPKDSGSSR